MSDPPTFFCGEIILDEEHGLVMRRTCIACWKFASIYAKADLCEECCVKYRSYLHAYVGTRCRYCGAEKPGVE